MLGGFNCSRNSLVALNIFYITVGIFLIIIGAHWMTSNRITSLPIIGGVVACGVFLLVVSTGGIYATIKQHQVLLFFYMVILFCLFIIQFSIACACLAVSEDMQKSIARQGWSSVDIKVKENVQHAYGCCGFEEDRSDLGHVISMMSKNSTAMELAMAHPSCQDIDKCCKGAVDQCCVDNCTCAACVTELKSQIGQAFRVTGGVSLFFSFTEFIGIWLTVRYRNQRNPYIGGCSSAFL